MEEVEKKRNLAEEASTRNEKEKLNLNWEMFSHLEGSQYINVCVLLESFRRAFEDNANVLEGTKKLSTDLNSC